MEDSVSTILYLVITFIILVTSLLKKKKKARPKPVSTGSFESPAEEKPIPPKTPKKGFESLFQSLLEDQSPFAPEYDPVVKAEEDFQDEFYADEPEEEKEEEAELKSTEGVSAFSHDDPATSIIETGLKNSMATKGMKGHSEIEIDTSTDELGLLVKDFEARKAIIYSEILKPKYF